MSTLGRDADRYAARQRKRNREQWGKEQEAWLLHRPAAPDDTPRPVLRLSAEQLVAELEIIREWRECITCRHARVQEILETVGLTDALHDSVCAEARILIDACRSLAERIPDCLGHSRKRERRTK